MIALLLALIGCDASTDGPWKGFSIHPIVESGGTTMPHRGSDTPLQVGPAAMDGSCVQSALVVTEVTDQGAIQARLTDECRSQFADFSEQNVGRKIALVVEGTIISAPVVQERIDSGRIMLSLQVSVPEAAAMLEQLSGK